MKKSIRLNDSARVMKVHGIMIVGNIENGSFIALNTDGEDIVEKARLDFFEIDMDKVSDDVKNVIDAGIECEIFDELNSERMKSACGIRAAYLHVTNKCNYNCIGCYSENSLRNCAKDLTTTDIKVIIDKLSGVGVEVLAVSGGEPFIREDILEILSYAKKKIKKVIIGSNGTMINEEIASKLPNIVDSVNRSANIDVMLNRNQTQEARERDFKARTNFHNTRSLELQEELVRRYSDQAIAPFMIFWEMKANVSLEKLKQLRALVDPSLIEHPYTKQLDEFIRLADFKVGSDMPDFKLPDKDGKDFVFSTLRGKYVLVDFWASWCGPCMREMPNVVKLYKECKGKNFEIVGISLDQKRDAWLNAVEKNKMKWIQVSDLKSWKTLPVKLCNISAVPYTVLVDPEGKVIALDLRGEELIKKVKEVLKK